MNLLVWFLGELHSSPSFKVRDGIHCAVSMMSQLGCGCQNNSEVLITVFLLLIQTNNNKYQFPSQVLPQASKQGVKDWNVNLNLLCNQERCFDFSWSSSCRFCSEGRKHSIMNGQSFRLPIEQRAVKLERHEKYPKSWVRCFTPPFWGGKTSKTAGWAMGHNTIANFCVANWVEHNTAALNSKYPHTIKDFSTPKHPPWSRHH